MIYDNLIEVDPEKMSGAPVFPGARVPVNHLFEHLEGGDPLDEFLDQFPSVSREQALRVLNGARNALLTHYEIAGS